MLCLKYIWSWLKETDLSVTHKIEDNIKKDFLSQGAWDTLNDLNELSTNEMTHIWLTALLNHYVYHNKHLLEYSKWCADRIKRVLRTVHYVSMEACNMHGYLRKCAF